MNQHRGDRKRLGFVSRSASMLLMVLLAGCSGGNAGGNTLLPGIGAGSNLQGTITTAADFGSYASTVQTDMPLAYYRLDNTSGTTVADGGSGATSGTDQGAITLGATSLLATSGNPATTLAGGSVQVGTDAAAQPTGAISVEAWVRPNASSLSASLSKIVANSQPWSAPYETYLLGLQQGVPFFRLVVAGTPFIVPANVALTGDASHHLVGTYDGSTLRLWVDGRLAGAVGASGAISNYSKDGLAIGADVTGKLAFRGTIGDVAIYDHALSLHRILIHEAAGGATPAYVTAVLAANPMGYYRLGETFGSTAYDASATSQDGTYDSSVTLGGTGVLTALDPTASFPNAIVAIPRNLAQFPSQTLTVEAIAQPSAAALNSQEVKLVSAGTPWAAPYDSYKLALDKGHPSMEVATNAGNFQVVADASVTTGGVYHLAGTYDGATVAIYGNGVLLKSMPATGSLYLSSGTGVAIAGDVTKNWLYQGSVDDVAFYATALSSSVIAAHAGIVPGLSSLTGVVSPTAPPAPTSAPPTPTPTPVPTPTLVPAIPGPLTLSTLRVDLLSLANSENVTIQEANFTGAFNIASTTCSSIATLSLSTNHITIVPRASGTCQVTVSDGNGQTANFSVAVTLTAILGQ